MHTGIRAEKHTCACAQKHIWTHKHKCTHRNTHALIKTCSNTFILKYTYTRTWMAVRAATMAGDPNPWVIKEKWVRCLWMFWSKIMAGFVLHKGDRSWFSKSISSFVTILKKRNNFYTFNSFFFEDPTLSRVVNLSACTARWGLGICWKDILQLAWQGILFRRHSQNLWLNGWPLLEINNKNW